MKVELVRVTEDPKMAIALAASNCYDSIPREQIVDHCYKSGHHSVLEFAVFHFHIEGVSRALTHQLVRHRLASYAQRSQRYCKEDGFRFVIPDSIANSQEYVELKVELNPENDIPMLVIIEGYVPDLYNLMMELNEQFYTKMVDLGVSGEDARFILPNACESVIDVQMNFRELMAFMNERLCSKAQWEIRHLANRMKHRVVEKYPEMLRYMIPKCEKHKPYCFCLEENGCGRHPHISKAMKGVNEQ